MQEGTFKAKAIEWQLGEAKTGTPQIAIKFALLDGGETITYYGSFSEKAYEYTVANLRACGWKGSDLENLTTLGDNEVELVLENEEYNGKTKLKVKFINGGAMLKAPMDAVKTKSFAASMKAKIEALGKVPAKGDLPF